MGTLPQNMMKSRHFLRSGALRGGIGFISGARKHGNPYAGLRQGDLVFPPLRRAWLQRGAENVAVQKPVPATAPCQAEIKLLADASDRDENSFVIGSGLIVSAFVLLRITSFKDRVRIVR